MIAYKNRHGTQTYPFTSTVPFPQGLIKDIKVVLKKSTKQPYISKISCGNNSLQIVLSTVEGCLGIFIYADSSWITLDNDQVFGFIQLAVEPSQVFSYTGIWRLHRSCYTFGNKLKGLQKISANGLALEAGRILDIQLAGDLTIRQSAAPFIVNIGRDQDPHQQYTVQMSAQQPYITAVNGLPTSELILRSSDSSIKIQQPIQVQNSDVYVMYISTSKDFPHCSQWDSDSFSGV